MPHWLPRELEKLRFYPVTAQWLLDLVKTSPVAGRTMCPSQPSVTLRAVCARLLEGLIVVSLFQGRCCWYCQDWHGRSHWEQRCSGHSDAVPYLQPLLCVQSFCCRAIPSQGKKWRLCRNISQAWFSDGKHSAQIPLTNEKSNTWSSSSVIPKLYLRFPPSLDSCGNQISLG